MTRKLKHWTIGTLEDLERMPPEIRERVHTSIHHVAWNAGHPEGPRVIQAATEEDLMDMIRHKNKG